MNFKIETEQAEDGRWIGEVPALPGVLAYGETSAQAISRAEIRALPVNAEHLEHHEARSKTISNVVPV